ncbi:RNF213 [Mytilus coruscus]|uniref:RNF213 n=1 Tax=Mytilus coruscus TaxID=42192 RepID=A0A6J8E5B4_MYTCO|nr:RNF213 [Mytilus coruscus]
MPLLAKDADFRGGKVKYVHHCLAILPSLCCRGPQESKEVLSNMTKPNGLNTDILFDELEFQSSTFQRPYHYLKRYSEDLQIDFFNPAVPSTDAADCLQELLKYCGIKDPSWSELYHFVSFLDKQLEHFEGSVFCSSAAMGVNFAGFPKFVLRFLILMSRDFSTRSLKVSEESPSTLLNIKDTEGTGDDNVIEQYGMRRTWETSPHPYLFFNPDGHTMTFLGFDIDRKSGDLTDQQSGKILEKSIITTMLFDILVKNGVNLNENFDKLPRADKLKKLRQVMGSTSNIDPDPTYELTTDNVKKILAIYMRFRCDIPVLIMGETGCGKTRLIRFMCLLQLPIRLPDESDEKSSMPRGKGKMMLLNRNARRQDNHVQLPVNRRRRPRRAEIIGQNDANPQQPLMPPQQSLMPPQHPVMPQQQPVMPQQQPVMPPQQPVMPSQQPLMPPQQPLMPPQQPLMQPQQP